MLWLRDLGVSVQMCATPVSQECPVPATATRTTKATKGITLWRAVAIESTLEYFRSCWDEAL